MLADLFDTYKLITLFLSYVISLSILSKCKMQKCYKSSILIFSSLALAVVCKPDMSWVYAIPLLSSACVLMAYIPSKIFAISASCSPSFTLASCSFVQISLICLLISMSFFIGGFVDCWGFGHGLGQTLLCQVLGSRGI